VPLYRCQEWTWEHHEARQHGRLVFENERAPVNTPEGIAHKAYENVCSRYTEVEKLFHLRKREVAWENEPADRQYQSEIRDSFHVLPKHVIRLVGYIPALTLPANLDPTEPQDLIVATDGSVLFDVRYHSWLVSTKDEEIIVTGSGPGDGAPHHMPSYRSELRGLFSGMVIVGTMA
jgi:hypothetical protein